MSENEGEARGEIKEGRRMIDELVILRSVSSGKVKCPLKRKSFYWEEMKELSVCAKCQHHKGFFEMPRCYAVACSKEDETWRTNATHRILPLSIVKQLPKWECDFIIIGQFKEQMKLELRKLHSKSQPPWRKQLR